MELISKAAVRPDDLFQYLNQHRPHIVHFSGHGSRYEKLYFVNDAGKALPVSTAAIGELFRTMKDNIRVVVLNACY
ncbi:MAG: hypothetical protein Q8K93_30480, partial [Reyranella sp.]|nr:hypothetical protein [Reyranella sp.]